jgi:REP element-mobilizing transposase RayT
MSVSGFMGYLKGKSALLIFQKWGNFSLFLQFGVIIFKKAEVYTLFENNFFFYAIYSCIKTISHNT